MVGAQFADPVLAVNRRDLIHGYGVVVKAKPVGRKSSESLIDDAGAEVNNGLIIESISNTKPRLKVLPGSVVKSLAAMLGCVKQDHATCRTLGQPAGLRQSGQAWDRCCNLTPIPT